MAEVKFHIAEVISTTVEVNFHFAEINFTTAEVNFYYEIVAYTVGRSALVDNDLILLDEPLARRAKAGNLRP